MSLGKTGRDREMDVNSFHAKLKQHCTKLDGSCIECCFRELCYTPPRLYSEDLLNFSMDCILDGCETNGQGLSIPCIPLHCLPSSCSEQDENTSRDVPSGNSSKM